MSSVSSTSNTGSAQLSTNQFLQLLVAQLQNQDPLNPVNPQDFVTQLATLNSVEGLNSLNTSFSQMLQLQQLTQGASLIGKTVNYTPTNGSPTTGTVSAVTAQNGQFVLTVGSNQVTLSQIQSLS
ncbi:Flagellar basal-body rod modification protein FlgD [Frigoriglobus tundricola]|uniref:Basal-body rod modification protein FlgD n=2 Tax=Frigoriglobus tundricola TaxID=2774151 RepID=A0A6M5YLZ8_9BACT|nr:Flagellar basal-body rod modification protein FlgD [Frigoriglobus tundricola]